MKYQDFINSITQQYTINSDLLRDIKWLISYSISTPPTPIHLLPDTPIPNHIIPTLLTHINQLTRHTPLAYILGNVEFYGNTLTVTPDVLIPRPETELLCDTIIQDHTTTSQPLHILDLCTGSGCIAITLAQHIPSIVTASDISTPALEIAQQNAHNLHTPIHFVHSDMFDKITGKFDIIVSNPPYIPTSTINTLQPSVQDYEPHLALDGDTDGLKFYQIISQYAPQFLQPNGQLYLEIGYNQATAVSQLLMQNFIDICTIKDYNNLDRIITAKLRSE